jgi:predicted HTH domain antitoxin
VIVSEIVLSIPEQLLETLRLTPQQAAPELLLAAAVKLFELGRLSSGAAARLAGLPRPMFLAKLGEYGVDTFRLTQEELQEETPLA